MSAVIPPVPPVWWCIRTPWNQCVAIDEFGGRRNYGCSAYAIANMEANYLHQTPSYALGEGITNEMIVHGWFLVPPTSGATMQNVHDELVHRGYTIISYIPEQGSTIPESELRAALVHQVAVIIMVANAEALQSNEQNVFWHFVCGAGYDAGADKIYILNSDVAGQHGVATGQWQPVRELMQADPRGLVVVPPKVAPPTPPPPPDVHGASVDIQAALTSLTDAYKRLNP